MDKLQLAKLIHRDSELADMYYDYMMNRKYLRTNPDHDTSRRLVIQYELSFPFFAKFFNLTFKEALCSSKRS